MERKNRDRLNRCLSQMTEALTGDTAKEVSARKQIFSIFSLRQSINTISIFPPHLLNILKLFCPVFFFIVFFLHDYTINYQWFFVRKIVIKTKQKYWFLYFLILVICWNLRIHIINMTLLLLTGIKGHFTRKHRKSLSNQKIYWWVHLCKI